MSVYTRAVTRAEEVPKGTTADGVLPCDFILTRGESVFNRLTHLGQKLRIHGDDRRYTEWDHAALITSNKGDLIEATFQGVQEGHLDEYRERDYILVRIRAGMGDRYQGVRYAKSLLGQPYGYLTIASLVISTLTGSKFVFSADGRPICSGMVARALERTGALFDRDPSHIAPADLAKYFKVEFAEVVR